MEVCPAPPSMFLQIPLEAALEPRAKIYIFRWRVSLVNVTVRA